jgi:hypothetical protein
MRPPLKPAEVKRIIENSPDLSPFILIGKDDTLPNNGGHYEFEVSVEYTGDKHAVIVRISVKTGIEIISISRILQNITRHTGIEEIKKLCSDTVHYFVASMFTSFPEVDFDEELDAQLGEEEGDIL